MLVVGGIAGVAILAIVILWGLYFSRLPGLVQTISKPAPQLPPPETASSNMPLGSELSAIADLHAKGLLTDQEFEQAKTKLLK